MPDPRVLGPLASVPLFEGFGEDDLADLGATMRVRVLDPGADLWRQGSEPREVVFVVSGTLAVRFHGPAGQEIEMGRAGPGAMVGEIGLLDGGAHTMGVVAAEETELLVLGRTDFMALLARLHPTAFAVKRRLAAIFVSRLRNQLDGLTGPVGPGPVAGTEPGLEFGPPPDSAYVRRLATFHGFDPLAVWGLLTAGRYARCGPGTTLVEEGATSDACYLTVNGAVEKVRVRDGQRARVGLAGPGRAFGYEGLVDGGTSPVTAVTRERVLLLVIDRPAFERLFGSEDMVSRVFLDVLQHDLVASVRQTLQPLARMSLTARA